MKSARPPLTERWDGPGPFGTSPRGTTLTQHECRLTSISLWPAPLFKPTLAKLDVVPIWLLWLDLFSGAPLAPFLLEMTHVPAGRNGARFMIGFGIDPALKHFFDGLRHRPPAPEMDHVTIKAWDVIRKVIMLQVVFDDVGDEALELLRRGL